MEGKRKGRPKRSNGEAARANRETHDETAPESEAAKELPEGIIFGRNAIAEALRSGRSVNRLLIAGEESAGPLHELATEARERDAVVEIVPRSRIDALAKGLRHQGALAYVSPIAYASLEDILERTRAKASPFLLLLDEIEDPHNLGALLRTADAVGVDGVLIPKRRCCPLSATVAKTSAGAVEHVPVARIGNIVQTLRLLKKEGFWIVGGDMAGAKEYFDAELTGALVLVAGNEGKGISRLVKENCDFLVRIPMMGKINSLNVSVAGALLMYEAFRQRRQASG